MKQMAREGEGSSSRHKFLATVQFYASWIYPCFLHCRRCRRGSSWHPLEEDQSRKWVPLENARFLFLTNAIKAATRRFCTATKIHRVSHTRDVWSLFHALPIPPDSSSFSPIFQQLLTTRKCVVYYTTPLCVQPFERVQPLPRVSSVRSGDLVCYCRSFLYHRSLRYQISRHQM